MQLLPSGKQQFIDGNGAPLANGLVYMYAPGTTTTQATYQDAAGTIQNPNPITLDANGQAVIWGVGSYRQVVTKANGTLIWDQQVSSPDLNAPLVSLAAASGANLIGYGATTVGAALKTLGAVVPSIAALKALDHTKYAQAVVTGYYAASDGGGGIYCYDASDTTATDNKGTVIVAADGGRWKLAGVKAFNVHQFGAKGDGSTDDAAAIQATINACATAGGGYVDFNGFTYAVASTLTINNSGVKLRGVGAGANHDFGPPGINSGASMLKWTGAAGGTMVSIKPSNSATSRISDNSVTGIYLNSNGGTGGTGLSVMSSRFGRYDIAGDQWTNTLMYLGAVSGLSESSDPQQNEIWIDWRNTVNSGSGLILDGNASANSSFNQIRRVIAVHYNGEAVLFSNADNNDVDLIAANCVPGGTGHGVRFKAASNNAINARNNKVRHFSSNAGAYSEGTEGGAAPAYDNEIMFQDTGNGTPTPLIGPGSSLWWGSNNAPVGMRVSSDIAPQNGVNTQVYSDGKVRFSGYTSAIAAGGSTTITFPTSVAMPSFQTAVPCTINTGIMALGVTGNGNATFNLSAQVNSNASITIYNNSAVSAIAFWWVEGK